MNSLHSAHDNDNDNDNDEYCCRRRYWHLAHSGGIYLEGMESAEPWKLDTISSATTALCSPPPAKKPKLELAVKVEEDNKENALLTSTPLKVPNQPIKLNEEVSITPKSTPQSQHTPRPESKYTPKTTPNAERMNMFNHSAYFNMSLSPLILNGAVTITPKVIIVRGMSSPQILIELKCHFQSFLLHVFFQ